VSQSGRTPLVATAYVGTLAAIPVLLLAACVAGRPAPSAAGPGSRTGAPGASGGGQTAGSGPTSPAASPRCTSRDLVARAAPDYAEPHVLQWTVTLTNVADHPCRLRGWVGVEVISVTGRTATVDTLAVERAGTATDVVVRPDESAYTILTQTSTDNGRCAAQPTLGVIPPAETEELWADFSGGSVCNGRVVASALAAGAGP